MSGNLVHPGAASSDTPVHPLTLAAFRGWLRKAQPSDRIVYHVGLLAPDRALGSPLEPRIRIRLHLLAAEVLAAAEAGHLALVQRRLGDGTCAYLAVVPGARPRSITATSKG